MSRMAEASTMFRTMKRLIAAWHAMIPSQRECSTSAVGRLCCG